MTDEYRKWAYQSELVDVTCVDCGKQMRSSKYVVAKRTVNRCAPCTQKINLSKRWRNKK